MSFVFCPGATGTHGHLLHLGHTLISVKCSAVLWVIDNGANEATYMLHVKGIDTIQTPENPL